jgi:hypothetical protein
MIKLSFNCNREFFRGKPISENFHATPLGDNIARVESVLNFAPPCTYGDHIEYNPRTREFVKIVDRVRRARAALGPKEMEESDVRAVREFFDSHNCPTETGLYGNRFMFSFAVPMTMSDEEFFDLASLAPWSADWSEKWLDIPDLGPDPPPPWEMSGLQLINWDEWRKPDDGSRPTSRGRVLGHPRPSNRSVGVDNRQKGATHAERVQDQAQRHITRSGQAGLRNQ